MTTRPLSLEQQLRHSITHVRAKKVAAAMSNAAAETSTAIVVQRDVSGPLQFTQEQEQMIRDTFANGANESEFRVLLEVSRVRRLNPLLKQIHFVKRWNGQLRREVWSAQVSVDGLRAIAERTGKYDGQDEPEYGPAGKGGYPEWCKVKVYRKDWSRPAVGIAYWSEYVQTTKDGAVTQFWARMPHVMLAKCAEGIAMRKAFPEDMSGLYVEEEMQQADNGAQPTQLRITPHDDLDQQHEGPCDIDLIRDLYSRFSRLEDDIDACDSWDKCNALRAILGTRAQQSELTKLMQAKAEAGDINPSQRQELGKTWMRCNRKLEKQEKRLAPGPEQVMTERQPGDDSDEEPV